MPAPYTLRHSLDQTMTGRATVAGMTATDEVRPHLTDARIKANQTYQRRRARSAADYLLDIDPALWDDATRKILLETLPRLAKIEPWEIEALRSREPEPLQAAWCDYHVTDAVSGALAPCTLPEGHAGACDPDLEQLVEPPAGPWHCLSRHEHATPDYARACDALPRAR